MAHGGVEGRGQIGDGRGIAQLVDQGLHVEGSGGRAETGAEGKYRHRPDPGKIVQRADAVQQLAVYDEHRRNGREGRHYKAERLEMSAQLELATRLTTRAMTRKASASGRLQRFDCGF